MLAQRKASYEVMGVPRCFPSMGREARGRHYGVITRAFRELRSGAKARSDCRWGDDGNQETQRRPYGSFENQNLALHHRWGASAICNSPGHASRYEGF